MSQKQSTDTNEQGSVLTPWYDICLSRKKALLTGPACTQQHPVYWSCNRNVYQFSAKIWWYDDRMLKKLPFWNWKKLKPWRCSTESEGHWNWMTVHIMTRGGQLCVSLEQVIQNVYRWFEPQHDNSGTSLYSLLSNDACFAEGCYLYRELLPSAELNVPVKRLYKIVIYCHKLLSQSQWGHLICASRCFQRDRPSLTRWKSYPSLSYLLTVIKNEGHCLELTCEFIKATFCRGHQSFPAICQHIVIFIFLPSIYKHSQKLIHTHQLTTHTHSPTRTAYDCSAQHHCWLL